MSNSKMQNGPIEGAALVVLAGGQETTYQTTQHQQSITDAAILKSHSTATPVQKAKVMALLRQGAKTTFELREHAVLMPAVRIFELKRDGHTITTELLPLFDAQGIKHSKCARYHLITEAVSEVQS
ncbi:MAG: helix-turn-helix domain-containing protein [Telluria sp.]